MIDLKDRRLLQSSSKTTKIAVILSTGSQFLIIRRCTADSLKIYHRTNEASFIMVIELSGVQFGLKSYA